MTRPYNTSGYWCQIPWRDILDYGPPVVLDESIQELYSFTPSDSTVTFVFDVTNLSSAGEWHSNRIDNVLVAKTEVFAPMDFWKQGGCENGLLHFGFFDLSQVAEGDPGVAFKDLFVDGARPEWTTGDDAQVSWDTFSSSLPQVSLPPWQANGSLGLGKAKGPQWTSLPLTVTGLEPGQPYALSFWWYTSVPSGAKPELIVSAFETPRLSSGGARFDSIEPEPGQPYWFRTWDYFVIDVPEGSRNLVVELDDLSEDADLYVRHGNLPDFDHADCVSLLAGTASDRCALELPEPGRWWIGVSNFDSAPISYSIRASWDEALDFQPLSPCRVLDTRNPPGFPLTSGWTDFVLLAGQCGVPWSAKAVSVNITAVNPTGSGEMVFWPANLPRPIASAISFQAGQNRANNAILGLATDGLGDLAVTPFVAGSGTVHLVVDVNGYFQ